MRLLCLSLLLGAQLARAEEVERPRLIGSVHLFPMTSFPDLLGGQITVHAIPWVDLHAGLSAFPGRFGWWVRGGIRFVIGDFRDDTHRGFTWRVSALAGYRAFRDAKADARGFSAQLSTDVTHFFLPHLGLTFQLACGGMYDDAAKRVLPELRLGVGLSF